ncbi:MAG: GumC family protein [Lysobacterales bacterium]
MDASVTTIDDDRPRRSDVQLLVDYSRRNWWVVLVCIVGAVALALVYLTLVKPAYRATAVLLIQPQAPEGDDRTAAVAATPALVRSQLEILKSERVLQETVDKLNLARDPVFTNDAPAGASAATKAAAAREELSKRVEVDNDGRSNTINLTAKAADPERAARIANTLANSFIDVQRNQKVRLIERTQQALGRQLDDLRDRTVAAEATAESYRQQAGLVPLSSIPEDSESYAAATPASREIIEMSKEHASLASQRAQSQARYQSQQWAIAHGQGSETPEVLNSSVVSDLRTREAQVAQRESELLARYRPDHPLVRPVQAELAAVRRDIGAEIQRIHSSVANQSRSSSRAFQAGDAFMGSLERARSRDLAASMRLTQLQREAKLQRATYEEYAAQTQRATERAGLQLPDVLLISPASPPLRSTGPRPALVVMIAAVLGMLIGFALGLVRSFAADRRIRVERSVRSAV